VGKGEVFQGVRFRVWGLGFISCAGVGKGDKEERVYARKREGERSGGGERTRTRGGGV